MQKGFRVQGLGLRLAKYDDKLACMSPVHPAIRQETLKPQARQPNEYHLVFPRHTWNLKKGFKQLLATLRDFAYAGPRTRTIYHYHMIPLECMV